MFNKISRYLYKVELVIVQVILVLIVALVFSAAVARSMGYPIIWSIEIAKILFMIVCFFCVDITLKENKHIGISYLVDKLNYSLQMYFRLFSLMLMLCFTIVLISKGFDLIRVYEFRMFNATGIPYRYVMPIIPFSFFLMTITMIAHIENTVREVYLYKVKDEKWRTKKSKRIGA